MPDEFDGVGPPLTEDAVTSPYGATLPALEPALRRVSGSGPRIC